MKVLAIVRANLIRTARDRMALFFSLMLPIILILVLGLTYGGQQTPRIGYVDDDGTPASERLVAALGQPRGDLSIDLRTFADVDALRDAVSRGLVELGIAIPSGYGAVLDSTAGATLTIVTAPTQVASATRPMVEDTIAAESSVVAAARFAMERAGVDAATALALAREEAADGPAVVVRLEPVGAAPAAGMGFSLGAQSQLILFIFLTSLTGAVELVITRQLGISRRMLATPTGMWTIIAGEGIGRVLVGLLQGVFIVAASAALFGVSWGDPVATAAIVLVFALVGGGAAMFVGSVASNPSQAGALAPALGLLLGLLGGSMVPSEVFPEAMKTLSHLTPHAWAMDAFRALNDGGTIVTIVPQLGVLIGFGVVLLGLSALRLRRVLAA